MHNFKNILHKYPRVTNLMSIVVIIALASLVFALRYKTAFSMPNFYAEDGTIFMQNIFQHNVLAAILTPFNGYLVTGQYLIADGAYLSYLIFDLPFHSLAFLIAVFSCLFLGLTVSLPFILFRKELGVKISLCIVAATAFVPLINSDYAVIGTIGNLKFIFLYWAMLFVIYRNIHFQTRTKTIVADIILLVCVTTNGPAILLLPFILLPYKKSLFALFKNPLHIRRQGSFGLYSAFVLLGLSFIYVVFVYLQGIPPMPGYLDSAYQWGATAKIIYRVTLYPFIFPVSAGLNDYVVALLLFMVLTAGFIINKKNRTILVLGLVSIGIATISFVVTRPGVSDYMLIYGNSPDQFFYTQNMIAVFIFGWIIKEYLRTKKAQNIAVYVTAFFVLCTAPLSSSYGKNGEQYKAIGSSYANTKTQCRLAKGEIINLPIYPSAQWNWTLKKETACQ